MDTAGYGTEHLMALLICLPVIALWAFLVMLPRIRAQIRRWKDLKHKATPELPGPSKRT
jgi:hypothetical protein